MAASNPTRPPVPREWIRGPMDELAIRRGYTFDPEPGHRVIKFLESFCKQSKGEWAGKPLEVMPWQRDFIMRLYGWRAPDGLRRFRTAYLEVAKKNGKSTLLSGLALYELFAAGEPGAEVYVNAVDRSQAGIIYDEAARMVAASPALRKILDPVPSRKTLTHHKSASRLVALSADVASKDGINPSFVIFDELHRQSKPDMWRIFRYSGGARRQPLTLSITTAGIDRHSVCWKQHEYTEKVNAGEITDDAGIRHLGVIYGATLADDYRDPATWAKANPSLGITLRAEDLAAELAEVEHSPSELNNWLRLRLNIWTQAVTSYISAEIWRAIDAAAAGVAIDLEELRGAEAYGGLDLSSTRDVAAFVVIVRLPDDDRPTGDGERYVAIARLWIPETTAAAREKVDRVPYLEWEAAGWLKTTPGERIDYGFIREEILELARTYQVKRIFSDPWNATQLLGELIEEGLPVEILGTGARAQNEPTKELERWAVEAKLVHDGNPALAWMIGNAAAEMDAHGNVKLSKRKSSEKIDGAAALVSAIAARTMPAGDDGEPSVYESRGMLSV